jgi:hypothetical protein
VDFESIKCLHWIRYWYREVRNVLNSEEGNLKYSTELMEVAKILEWVITPLPSVISLLRSRIRTVNNKRLNRNWELDMVFKKRISTEITSHH